MGQPDRDQLTRVIALVNNKGGVFKTTLASNIAGLLAVSGQRVLVVDLDPQASLAEDFGYTAADDNDEGTSLAKAMMLGGTPEIRRDVRPGLDVIVGGKHVRGVPNYLRSKPSDEARLVLANALAPIAGEYDMVLIDCPPGDELLQHNALAAARWVIVPTKSDSSSLKGLAGVAENFSNIVDVNPDIDLLGVVLVDVGTTAHAVKRRAIRDITTMFGTEDPLIRTSVRHAEAIAQRTRNEGKLVIELEQAAKDDPKWWELRRGTATATDRVPDSVRGVAADLQAITQELIERVVAGESNQGGAS